MKYWSAVFIYIIFAMFYFNYAQGCGKDESKPVMTGAACSIKDLKQQEQDTKKDKKDENKNKEKQKQKKTN